MSVLKKLFAEHFLRSEGLSHLTKNVAWLIAFDHYKIFFSKNKLVLNCTGIVRLLTFMTGIVLSDYLLYMKWIVPMRPFCCDYTWPRSYIGPQPFVNFDDTSPRTFINNNSSWTRCISTTISIENNLVQCQICLLSLSTIPEPLIKVTKRNAGRVLRFMESTMQISISRSEVQPGGIKKNLRSWNTK
jgi:hypothetical protein